MAIERESDSAVRPLNDFQHRRHAGRGCGAKSTVGESSPAVACSPVEGPVREGALRFGHGDPVDASRTATTIAVQTTPSSILLGRQPSCDEAEFWELNAQGCRFVERVLTEVQTLRLQNLSGLKFLRVALQAHRVGQPTAQLISNR